MQEVGEGARTRQPGGGGRKWDRKSRPSPAGEEGVHLELTLSFPGASEGAEGRAQADSSLIKSGSYCAWGCVCMCVSVNPGEQEQTSQTSLFGVLGTKSQTLYMQMWFKKKKR